MTHAAVRANQKDLYYLSQLTERFEDVSRSLLGAWGSTEK
jgi:peroxin-10